MEAKYYTRQNIIVALVVGILVGAGAYYLWDNRAAIKIKKDAASPNGLMNNEEIDVSTMPVDGSATEMIFTESANTVSAPDQPAGYRVVLNSVAIAKEGWVVIHEDAGGVPGNVLGAQRFDVGTYENSVVELLRNTTEGSTYYAMLHTDDGDKMFDLGKDAVMKNSQGAPIMTAFKVVPVR
ncbi:MAG: hypothetical protein AAB769_01270 [Patescibacteria group bacterium]